MKIFKKSVLILLVIMLTSCSSTVKQYVSYTIYPIGYLLERIAGDRINAISVQNSTIVQNANAIENFEEIINDSTYFFHIGDLEPYLDIYANEIAESGVNEVNLASINAIYKFQRYSLVYVGGKEQYIESSFYDDDSFGLVDTYELDEFIWLDPIGMLSMAKTIYNTLSSNYVEQASYFKENYEALEEDLVQLDGKYHELSSLLKENNMTISFVCMTPSFSSWQKAYGFQIYPVCLSKYGTLPTNDQLKIIKERIIKDGVKYIVYEPNMSNEMLELFQSIEKELGLTRIVLSNISSLTASQLSDNKDYLKLMNDNYNVLENIIVTEIEENK